MFRQQLTNKKVELTRAEETIRRDKQQIQEMRQQVSLLCIACVVTRGLSDCRRLREMSPRTGS